MACMRLAVHAVIGTMTIQVSYKTVADIVADADADAAANTDGYAIAVEV
jgi:hypothetical protein